MECVHLLALIFIGICSRGKETAGLQPCIFGLSDSCAYQCNCASNTICNSTTGECPDGCKEGMPRVQGNESLFDWRGPACRIGNVALGKVASHKGTFEGRVAGRAIDGLLPPLGGDLENCAHTGVSKTSNAWWRVDLEDEYVIYNVTIFNRRSPGSAARTGSFNISIGNSSERGKNPLCTFYEGPAPAGGNATVACNTNLKGRYVTLQKTGGIDPHIINICEVVVIGYKKISANCNNCVSPCDDVIGCTSCNGYEAPTCKTKCSGYYGINCALTCGACNGSIEACDHKSGTCSSGCQNWYLGDKCDTFIAERSFGSMRIQIVSVKSKTIAVTWQSAADIQANLASYYGYQVQYKVAGDTEFMIVTNVSHEHGRTQYNTDIENLEYNTEYIVRVALYRRHGKLFNVTSSQENNTIVPCIAPLISQDPTFERDVMNGVLTVTWMELSPGCTNITSILIRYRVKNGDWKTIDVENPASQHTLDIMVQETGTLEVKVSFTNNANLSLETKVYKVKGEDGVGGVGEGGAQNVAVIAGSVVAGVVVIAAVIIVVIVVTRMKRRDNTDAIVTYEKHNRSGSFEKPFTSVEAVIRSDANSEISSDTQDSNQAQEMAVLSTNDKPAIPQKAFDNPALNLSSESSEYVKTADLSVTEVKAHMVHLSVLLPRPIPTKDGKSQIEDGYGKEFHDLPGEHIKPRKVGSQPVNAQKNRFKNIHPFDESRVKLEEKEGLPGSDYINASYISGYPNIPKQYIATQGPLVKTLEAFWQMIWQEGCNRIVMLTKLSENRKRKCEQYWPEALGKSQANQAGPFKIVLQAEMVHGDYTYRKLLLLHKDKSRVVHHLQFTSWDDKSCPEDNFPLLALRARVMRLNCPDNTPLVVHCSAGVGRTGTYIALDYLLKQASHQGRINVYQCIHRLRLQRMLMVQTTKQYKFLYQAVLEGIETRVGETAIPTSEYLEKYDVTIQDSIYSNQSTVSEQYEAMSKYRDGTTKLTDVNDEKNIYENFQQKDTKHRPSLSTIAPGSQGYIEAVFIDGFEKKKEAIITRMPSQDTAADFWSMIYDHECHSIVMLNEHDKNDTTCTPYWPNEDNGKIKHGSIQIQYERNELRTSDNIVVKVFQIMKLKRLMHEEPRKVVLYQILDWQKNESIPPNTEHVHSLIELVCKEQTQHTAGCTVVHCRDGAERSGLFVAGMFVVDLIKAEQEVDVLLAARYVTSRIPEAIASQEQYQYLFEIAKQHLSGYHTYGNI